MAATLRQLPPLAMLNTPVIRSFVVVGNARAVGKTLVACTIVHFLREAGIQAIAMKPAAIAEPRGAAGSRSSELEQLAAASAFGLPTRALCPLVLSPGQPAPTGQEARCVHDAAVDTYRVLSTWGDVVVIEGADDLTADAGRCFDSAGLALELELPALAVVGVQSGCVASAQARIADLMQRGVACAGWIGNVARADVPNVQGELKDLCASLPVPCLGVIPSLAPCTPALAARAIDIERTLLALAG